MHVHSDKMSKISVQGYHLLQELTRVFFGLMEQVEEVSEGTPDTRAKNNDLLDNILINFITQTNLIPTLSSHLTLLDGHTNSQDAQTSLDALGATSTILEILVQICSQVCPKVSMIVCFGEQPQPHQHPPHHLSSSSPSPLQILSQCLLISAEKLVKAQNGTQTNQ